MRVVRHRHDDSRAFPGSRPLEERGEDLGHRAERASGEIGDLHGWKRRRGRLEHARPPQVVEIVTGALLVRAADAEARDGAVDRVRPGRVGADPELRRNPGPKRLEHDVRLPQELRALRPVRLLLPGMEQAVPLRGRRPHRVAAGPFHPDDARAEAQELRARERPWEVAREVDHERFR